jgi:uncharacterized protein with GYD domain
MSAHDYRAYVLIEIRPGSEKEFAEYVNSKGATGDINMERMDFVHGSYDVVVLLRGTMKSIDARIMELRKSPLILRTETLLCFEEDMMGRLNE